MPSGTVKSVHLDRGFGFIACEGRDLFFHAKQVDKSIDFDDRLKGMEVTFDLATHDGRERAVYVRPFEVEDDIPQVRREG